MSKLILAMVDFSILLLNHLHSPPFKISRQIKSEDVIRANYILKKQLVTNWSEAILQGFLVIEMVELSRIVLDAANPMLGSMQTVVEFHGVSSDNQ